MSQQQSRSNSQQQLVPCGSADYSSTKLLTTRSPSTSLVPSQFHYIPPPSVPLDQYQALLRATEFLMSAMNNISSDSKTHQEAVDMAKKALAEMLNAGNNTNNNEKSSAAPSRSTTPPPPIAEYDGSEIDEAENENETSKKNNNNNQSRSASQQQQQLTKNEKQEQEQKQQRQSSSSSQQQQQQQQQFPDGEVGPGLGGAISTVRENIVEGGKLVKLIGDAHPFPGKTWTLQNTTTNLQFIVTFTFSQHSDVVPLGDTIQIFASNTSNNNNNNVSSNKTPNASLTSTPAASPSPAVSPSRNDSHNNNNKQQQQQKTFRISLYPGEAKPFVRSSNFSHGYRMSLRFGPPDSGYDATNIRLNNTNNNGAASSLMLLDGSGGKQTTVLSRLEEIRRDHSGYISLRDAVQTCLDAGTSFIDIEFPPSGESISRTAAGMSGSSELAALVPIRWERPERFLPLGEKPELAAGFDARSLMWVIPRASQSFAFGKIGGGKSASNANASGVVSSASSASSSSSWVVGAASLLASNPQTASFLLAALRRCTVSDATSGLFRVELCHGGLWRNVVVDSLMPCHRETRELLSAKCLNPPEHRRDVWGAVVEKAFAKVLGSYSALMNPFSASASASAAAVTLNKNDSNNSDSLVSTNTCYDQLEALLDITGGVVERLDWRAKDVGVFAAIQSALHSDAQRLCWEMITIPVVLSNNSNDQQQQKNHSPSGNNNHSQQQQHQSRSGSIASSSSSSVVDYSNNSNPKINLHRNANHHFLTHLGLLPGHCYRVLATASAEGTRMILLDDPYYNQHHFSFSNNNNNSQKNNEDDNINNNSISSSSILNSSSPTQLNSTGPTFMATTNRVDLKVNDRLGDNFGQHLMKDMRNASNQLPLRGLGLWAIAKNWAEHPALSQACRDEVRNVVKLYFNLQQKNKFRQNYNNNNNNSDSSMFFSGEIQSLMTKRFVWLDWKDAVFCFDGAGLLKVAPELSLGLGITTSHAGSQEQQQQDSDYDNHENNNNSNASGHSSPVQKKQQQGDEEGNIYTDQQQHVVASPSQPMMNPSAVLSTISSSAFLPPPNYRFPRSFLHKTTLDIRIPNRFQGAIPDWMLEIYIPLPPPIDNANLLVGSASLLSQQQQQNGELPSSITGYNDPQNNTNTNAKPQNYKPVTLYIGLHQRDRRGLDPCLPLEERAYAATLLTVVGQSGSSGVWDAVAHSHNGTYWRGRDVQMEVTLEPRAKPYYIIPRRYASSSSAGNNSTNASRYEKAFVKSTATQEERQKAEHLAAIQQRRQLQEDNKEFVISLIVPDGLNPHTRVIQPESISFKKPTPDAMRAVRYSPVWRFEPEVCQPVDFSEYCVELQQQPQQDQMKNSLASTKKTTKEDVGRLQQKQQQIDDALLENAKQFEEHYFFRTVRSSLSVHNSIYDEDEDEDDKEDHNEHNNNNNNTVDDKEDNIRRNSKKSKKGIAQVEKNIVEVKDEDDEGIYDDDNEETEEEGESGADEEQHEEDEEKQHNDGGITLPKKVKRKNALRTVAVVNRVPRDNLNW